MKEYDGKFSIGLRNTINLWFANATEEEQELGALVESIDNTCVRWKMDVSAEDTKPMVFKQGSGILEQTSQMTAQKHSFSEGIHKLVQS